MTKLGYKTPFKLMAIGALQYGVMYVAYFFSFKYLLSYEVALLTTTTPIFVSLIYCGLAKEKPTALFTAVILAVIGGIIIFHTKITSQNFWLGFIFVQISNLCFAIGQVQYKLLTSKLTTLPPQHQIFALLYLGAAVVALIPALANLPKTMDIITSKQILYLLYLGAIPSGLCFYLWNYGATKTNSYTLAIFNNLKIPIAILCSILIFKENYNVLWLSIGTLVMLGSLLVSVKKQIG